MTSPKFWSMGGRPPGPPIAGSATELQSGPEKYISNQIFVTTAPDVDLFSLEHSAAKEVTKFFGLLLRSTLYIWLFTHDTISKLQAVRQYTASDIRVKANQRIEPTRALCRLLGRVARLGRKAPIGLLLTVNGTIKFGFGALIATFWATFRSTGNRFGMEISRFWATFCHDLAPGLQKNQVTLVLRLGSGPSRATAGPGKPLSRGPITTSFRMRRDRGANVGTGVPSSSNGSGGAS